LAGRKIGGGAQVWTSAAGAVAKRFNKIEKNRLLQKLDMRHQARELNDYRAPQASRLEALRGDRNNQNSIRITA
jgi:plasmid maintenance system killer protein